MDNQPHTPRQQAQPPDASPLMKAVAAIVEATLARQGITLPPVQRQSRWKASQRRQWELGLPWYKIGWKRT
ncbi:MAG: hypothetical protein HY533_06815 [Chloroflexi bacterium]|nr:hypothetical protein [Chloroflexota bacterium]